MAMGKVKLIFGLAVLGLAIIVGWQIASLELANSELQSDLRDFATQAGARIGLNAPSTDDDLRNAVIHKAEEYGIPLEAQQVTVQHTGTGATSAVRLSVDYQGRVNLPGFSFFLHFTPSSPG